MKKKAMKKKAKTTSKAKARPVKKAVKKTAKKAAKKQVKTAKKAAAKPVIKKSPAKAPARRNPSTSAERKPALAARTPINMAEEHEGATEDQVGDRTGPGAGYDTDHEDDES